MRQFSVGCGLYKIHKFLASADGRCCLCSQTLGAPSAAARPTSIRPNRPAAAAIAAAIAAAKRPDASTKFNAAPPPTTAYTADVATAMAESALKGMTPAAAAGSSEAPGKVLAITRASTGEWRLICTL